MTGASPPATDEEHRPCRPTADIVVPYHGSQDGLAHLLELVERIELGPDDTLTVVHNGPPAAVGVDRSVGRGRAVVVDTDVPSSYHARNAGAARGRGAWLIFIDADVIPPADLIMRYLASEPPERTGVLAGEIVDEPTAIPDWRRPAARYAHLRSAMSQANTLAGAWPYAQTANCAVRRVAFEEIGGFRASIRSGGDADLCFRLQRRAWRLEPRPQAAVTHLSRPTLGAMLRQRARHGSGARWLNREYPGSYPASATAGTVVWSIRQASAAIAAIARRDPDRAILLGVEVLSYWAFELGRVFGNDVAPRAQP